MILKLHSLMTSFYLTLCLEASGTHFYCRKSFSEIDLIIELMEKRYGYQEGKGYKTISQKK